MPEVSVVRSSRCTTTTNTVANGGVQVRLAVDEGTA
jgi:hypothetical protein